MNSMPVMTQATMNSSVQSTFKNESSSTGTSSFLQLLGGLLVEQTGESDSKQTDEEAQDESLTILDELNRSGLVLTEKGIDSEEAADLLSLLPVEWKEDLFDLISGNGLDKTDMSELENALLALLAVVENESKSARVNETILNQLKQTLAKSFPHLTLAGNGQKILEDVTKHIEAKIEASPRGQASGQSFLGLLTNKESTNLTLPNSPFMQLRSEGSSQGLNISGSGQELGQAMSRTEQAAIHLGDKVPKDVQQQQFLRQFQSILQRGVLTQPGQGMTTLSIKLYPEHLGRVDIQLTQIEGSIVAKILASSSASRELIETQLAQLRQAFAQQQIPVERIEVTQQYDEKDGQEASQQEGRDDKQQDDEQDNKEKVHFQDVLSELTFNEKV